ncbi:hypothetical protein, partial [Pseudomonas aeruginosa]
LLRGDPSRHSHPGLLGTDPKPAASHIRFLAFHCRNKMRKLPLSPAPSHPHDVLTEILHLTLTPLHPN